LVKKTEGILGVNKKLVVLDGPSPAWAILFQTALPVDCVGHASIMLAYLRAVNFFLAFKSQFAPKCKRWHHSIGTLNGGKPQKKPKR
jgi:hypothetical protein